MDKQDWWTTVQINGRIEYRNQHLNLSKAEMQAEVDAAYKAYSERFNDENTGVDVRAYPIAMTLIPMAVAVSA